MQTSPIQNYIFLDEYSRPHTLSTRYQAIPILEYTTNLDKNVKQHFLKNFLYLYFDYLTFLYEYK